MPAVYDVGKIEVCDDAVDGDDLNGLVNFDTSTIINGMLKDPNTGVVQDATLLNIEFTYFDQFRTTTTVNAKIRLLSIYLYLEDTSVTVSYTTSIRIKPASYNISSY